MAALGFRFDCDAVIRDGVAHRTYCPLVPAILPPSAMIVPAGGVYRSEWRPRPCTCAPPFETLLAHQVAVSGTSCHAPAKNGNPAVHVTRKSLAATHG